MDRNDENLSIDALERCSAAFNDWMLHNSLALNPDKSDAIMFGTSRAIASSKIKSVTVAGSAITISDKVKSLKVTWTNALPSTAKLRRSVKQYTTTSDRCVTFEGHYRILLRSL